MNKRHSKARLISGVSLALFFLFFFQLPLLFLIGSVFKTQIKPKLTIPSKLVFGNIVA